MIPALPPAATQLPVVEARPANNALILPPNLERIMVDPQAQQEDVNQAILAGFGRFGAFLQEFEADAQQEARRVGGQIRALVEEQNALQRRVDQEGPNNAVLRENLRQVNERLRDFLQANPDPRAQDLARRVGQLEIDQLRQRVAALERPAPQANNQPDPLAQLNQRMAALEARPAPQANNQPDPAIAQLRQRVAALERPVPAPAPRADNQPDPLAQLNQRMAALEARPAPNPAPNQAIPAPVLAILQRLEAAEDGKIRERENKDRDNEISRIRQRLLLNVAICERAAIAAGGLLVPSVAGDAISGGVLLGKVAGYIKNFGLESCVTKMYYGGRTYQSCSAVANPFPVINLLVFAGFTAVTIVNGIIASDKTTTLHRSQDLLNSFDSYVKSGINPQIALQSAENDINKKYNG